MRQLHARSHRGPIRGMAGPALPALPLALALALVSCSPDLQESVGPRIPIPNVSGLVVRGGVPVSDRKVKLADTATDSTQATDRTDAAGRFYFSEVGAGDWTIKVSSSDPGDFASVTYQFVFSTAETTMDVAVLELSMRGMEMKKPDDGAETKLPSFIEPLHFEWNPPGDLPGTVQVRLYDSTGQPFWFSGKLRATQVDWNGIGNQGDRAGRPAGPGSYTWRLRHETDNTTLESSTGYHTVSFKENIR